jgi:hypothetical protein
MSSGICLPGSADALSRDNPSSITSEQETEDTVYMERVNHRAIAKRFVFALRRREADQIGANK